jgi:hypothetical protein
MGDPQPNSGVRSIDDSRGLVDCQINAILRLQAAVWDDKTRVGYIRPIRLDRTLAIRAIFSGGGRENFLRELREYKPGHQRGADGIDGGQLTGLRWVHTRHLAMAYCRDRQPSDARPNAVGSPLGPSRCPNRR